MPTGMMPAGMMPTANGSFEIQNQFAFQSGFSSADVAGVSSSGAGMGSLVAGLMYDSIKQKAKVEALEKQREMDDRALFMAQFQQVLQYNKHGSL